MLNFRYLQPNLASIINILHEHNRKHAHENEFKSTLVLPYGFRALMGNSSVQGTFFGEPYTVAEDENTSCNVAVSKIGYKEKEGNKYGKWVVAKSGELPFYIHGQP